MVSKRILRTVGGPRSPLIFLGLVYALAIPFWLIGWQTGTELLPGLPIAALMAVCPVVAAVLLVYKEDGAEGVIFLLKRSSDYKRIKSRIWYLPTFLLMPFVAVLSYAAIRWAGTQIPLPRLSLLAAVVLFAIFFVAALGEELGWSGYAIDPLQKRWGALPASLLLGSVWALIHYVPLIEAHRSTAWIGWWSLGTVATRILMVWLYNNTGRSVFAVTLLHTMSNLSWQLFPIHGSYFDPRVNGLFLASLAAIIVIVWTPRRLTQLRHR